MCCFFFSSRRRHTRWTGDWSSDVCSSDLPKPAIVPSSVTPQISHLKRRTALNARRQSTPPSDSAPPHAALTGGTDGGTITGGVEPGGSGRWLIVMEYVPLGVARGVAVLSCVSSSMRVASPIPCDARSHV